MRVMGSFQFDNKKGMEKKIIVVASFILSLI